MKSVIKNSAAELFGTVDGTVEKIEERVRTMVVPVRKTVFERFPVTFTLLVTFGLVATMRGLDLLLAKLWYLNEHPLVLTLVGLLILVTTGTLYKKLG